MRRRLTLYFLAIVALTLFTMSLIAVITMRTSVQTRNAEKFSKLAGEISYNLDRLNRNGIDMAQLIAENPLISDETSDRETLRYELLKFRKMLPLYEDISIVAPDGTVLISTDFAGRGDWRHKRHFLDALEGRAAVSNVHLLTEPLAKVIQYTAPIRSGERVIAVVAVTINMRQFAETVEHLRIEKTGHALVTDQTGTIIIHHDQTRLFERIELPDDNAITQGFFFTERGAEYFGNTHAALDLDDAASFATPHWRVIVAQETGEMFAPLWSAIFFLSLTSLLIFILALFVFRRLAKRITEPLERLTQGIARIGEGQLDQRIEATGDDELRRLADAFNKMVGDLRESRRMLTASEQRYREMADMMPQTLFETDLQGRLVYSNQAGFKTFGYSEEDVKQGKRFNDFLLPSDRERAARNIQRILAGENTGGSEYHVRKLSGEILPVFIHSAPRYENERLAGLRGVVIDMSEIKQAQEEIKRKELQLIQAQKMESIGTLAGGLAHDFNNVLGGIGGASSLLTYLLEHDPANATPEKLLEYLELIDSQVKRASEMIRQLLALSRGQEIAFAPMDLAKAVEQVAAICEKTFEKSVQLRLTLPRERPLINGDAALIEQVILNVMVNAWHAMTIMRGPNEKQGGICAVTLEHIRVDNGFPGWPPDLPTGDHWSIRITDSGVGIPPDTLPRIFDPFYSTKKPGTGTGLGLPMAYNIIRQHHGHIKAASVPGKGSTFTLFLPALPQGGLSRAADPTAFIAHRGTGFALLADDEPAIRETTAEMLEMMGYNVLIATDGLEAVEIFKRDPDKISFLVLDLLMPRMSGIEALREIRRLRPDIRALIISGYRFDEQVQEAVSWGNLITLQKPFTVEQFSRSVKELTA
ncbi:MAG TPA: ATP-binding protein [bacterium]|nr:ATP-binding protein [bacterium]